MNFIRLFQFTLFIILEIHVNIITAQEAACEMNPTNQDTVDVLVYINGDTWGDTLWLSRYCSWKTDGFPYDQYAPVTIKVGGAITCDENDECNCPNAIDDQMDCASTFYHVCALEILGQEEYLKMSCCGNVIVNMDTEERRGFATCVAEKAGLADQIANCLENQDPVCPQEIALENAAEVLEKGVDLANNTEPFFFYNDVFDKCISDDSPGWFLQKICAMLKYETAVAIDQCVRAMGWTVDS